MLQHAGTKKCTGGPILKDVIYQYIENSVLVTASFCSSYQKNLGVITKYVSHYRLDNFFQPKVSVGGIEGGAPAFY